MDTDREERLIDALEGIKYSLDKISDTLEIFMDKMHELKLGVFLEDVTNSLDGIDIGVSKLEKE